MTAVLEWPDYLILVSFLVISMVIGIYHSLTGGKQRTMEEFIMANRRLKVIPTAISLLVTFQSAIAIIGFSAETYFFGIQYMIFGGIAMIIGVFSVGRIIVPWLFPLKLVSINEYLEIRFQSRIVRIFGGILGITTGVLYMGSAMYAPSAALESTTGLSLTISILAMGFVAVAYTALGGMRAVIWTDVFQFVIMTGGLVAILVKGLIAVGGFSKIFEAARMEGRLNWADLSPDPRVRHTVWGLLTGVALFWFSSYGFFQSSFQRFCAVENLSRARSTVLVNVIPNVLVSVIACAFGLITLAYYSISKCDPLANKDIQHPNQLLSYFVVNLFSDSPGFAGLFMATLFAAALSTVSSGLSAAAANVWEDMLQWKLTHLKETKKTLINRILVIVLGLLSTLIAILCDSVPGPVTQVAIGITGSVVAPYMGMFLLGGISRHTNWKGCLIGGFLGLTFSLWLSLGSVIYGPKPKILPPVSVEGCNINNLNSTYETPVNYTLINVIESTTSFYESFTGEIIKKDDTMYSNKSETSVLHDFYALSYLWIRFFPLILTMAVGFVSSLFFRDKELEMKVEDRLLIRLSKCCTCQRRKEEDNKDDANVMKLFDNVS